MQPAEHSPGPGSERSRVRRSPKRAAYDDETVHAILDAGEVVHVGLPTEAGPVVIPLSYGRDDGLLYMHGSVASRTMRSLDGAVGICATVTIVDGLVMARSAFHHSVNYRSVVAFGECAAVEGEEKLHGLKVISDHLMPGRWELVRPPSRIELRQTSVIRFTISEASAKVRSGGPNDEPEDLDLPVWAGVVPLLRGRGEPVPARS